jgi:hypothetical protein
MEYDNIPRNAEGTGYVENLKGIKNRAYYLPTHQDYSNESAKRTPGYKPKHAADADVIDTSPKHSAKKDKK